MKLRVCETMKFGRLYSVVCRPGTGTLFVPLQRVFWKHVCVCVCVDMPLVYLVPPLVIPGRYPVPATTRLVRRGLAF